MATSILESSPLVEGEADPFNGAGPMEAANGNFGGLQQALVSNNNGAGNTQVPPNATPPRSGLGQNRQNQLEEAIFNRVRSPEQMQEAEGRRRGALSKYQEAITAPQDTRDDSEILTQGILEGNVERPWDAGHGFRKGVADMYKRRGTKEEQTYKGNVEAAKVGLGFENEEEKLDSKDENAVLTDATRIATAGLKGSGAGSRGGKGPDKFKYVPGVGLLNMEDVDEQGNPKIVYPSGTLMNVFNSAKNRAQKAADAENMQWSSAAEKQAWVDEQASKDVAAAVEKSGYKVPPSALGVPDGMIRGNPSLSVAERKAGANVAPAAAPQAQSIDMGGPTAKPMAPVTPANFPKIEPQVQAGRDSEAKAIIQAEYDAEKNPANKERLGRELTRLSGAPARAPIDTSGVQPGWKPGNQIKAEGATVEAAAKADIERKAKFIDEPGMAAESRLALLDQSRDLVKTYTPGTFAPWKEKLGNVLEGMGFDNKLVMEAGNITKARKALQTIINDRMTMEKGVQARDDAVRFQAALVSITDPRDAFEFGVSQLREIDVRAISRQRFYQTWLEQNTSLKGADQAWREYVQNGLGRSFVEYGGKQVFRNDWIDGAIQANLAKNPKANREQIRTRAEQEWLKLSNRR